MKGHTKDECWKLHGKPPHVKSKSQQEGRSNFTETEQNDDQLSKEEMQLLRKILEKQNKSQTTPNVNLVQSGNSIVALNTVMTADDTWIVDSGATDHMTGNRGLFKIRSLLDGACRLTRCQTETLGGGGFLSPLLRSGRWRLCLSLTL